MKRLLLFFLLTSSLSYADRLQEKEQRIKELQNGLIHMSPLITACILLTPGETQKNVANYDRMIKDFNELLNELCRLQDTLHSEK